MSFVASTDAPDSDGDIVEQVWRLERFKSNPIILFGHDSRALPIGKATSIGVRDGQLEVDVTFASADANPMAEQVFQLVKEGMLNAVSVGFRPHEVRHERRDDRDVFVLSDNELMEISVVPIPANPEALAKMKAKAKAKESNLDPPREREQSADGGKEKEMEIQKMLDETKAALVAEQEKVNTLNERCKDLEEERNKYKAQVDEQRAKMVDKELDELIGKKITPREKVTLAKLASVDAELYAEHLKAVRERADMPHLEDDILPNDPTPPTLPDTDDGGLGLEKMIQRMAN